MIKTMTRVNFKQFKQKYPQYNHVSDEWLEWFIGFFEADGCFMIGINLSLVITQYELNKDILEEIQETLCIGRVNVQGKHIVPGRLWTYRFIVDDFKGQLILLELFRNNLVFPYRLKRYNDFISIFNEKLSRSKKFKSLKSDLNSVTETAFPSKKDAWFSGFMDGDGCFYASFTSKHRLVGSISFFNKNESSLRLFEHIKDEIFDGEGNVNITNKGLTYDTLSLKKGLPLVCVYFDRFNLKTTKIYDYLILLHVLEKYRNWESLDAQEIYQLVSLIKRAEKRQKKRDWKNVLQIIKKK
jgi:hypothetical protein